MPEVISLDHVINILLQASRLNPHALVTLSRGYIYWPLHAPDGSESLVGVKYSIDDKASEANGSQVRRVSILISKDLYSERYNEDKPPPAPPGSRKP
jgi:hypothetical protein